MDHCFNCIFFVNRDDVLDSCGMNRVRQKTALVNSGFCRRHAPQKVGDLTEETRMTGWPEVLYSDWCGDFVAAR